MRLARSAPSQWSREAERLRPARHAACRFKGKRRAVPESGTAEVGKTHLAIGIGHKAVDAGFKALFTTTLGLVETPELGWPTGQRKNPLLRGLENFVGWCRMLNWWRRRESNPRPRILCPRSYMLSPVFCIRR